MHGLAFIDQRDRAVFEVTIIKRLKIIDDSGTGCNLRMVRSGWSETLIKSSGIKMVPLIGKLFTQLAPNDHDTLMGSVRFIGREKVDIRIQFIHMRKTVGRIAYPIHTGVGTRLFRNCNDFSDRIYICNNIGTMRKTHKTNFVIKQIFQTLGVKAARLFIDAPFTHINPCLSQTTPRAGICLMILIGHYNCFARAQHLTERLRQNISILGCGGPETKLILLNTHPRRQPLTRLVHFLSAQFRGARRPIGLHFALTIKTVQPVYDWRTGIRTARIFKKCHFTTIISFKSWKLSTHKFNVEGH